MDGEALGRIIGLIILPFLLMALIGGVYYLAVRPRLTFRQAMFRWWVVALSLVLVLLSFLSRIVESLAAG